MCSAAPSPARVSSDRRHGRRLPKLLLLACAGAQLAAAASGPEIDAALAYLDGALVLPVGLGNETSQLTLHEQRGNTSIGVRAD